MPALLRPPRHALRRSLAVATIAVLAVVAPRSGALAQGLPARLADTTFWRMVNGFSEPGGYFRSDNFVSNEASYQWVIPTLLRTTGTGGVYLGVAPDQNFTYLVALRPKIAFIVDIRRQNMLQHLMYKALIERSADRSEFLSRLFARTPPASLDSSTIADTLMAAFVRAPVDSALARSELAGIVDALRISHGFALADSDVKSIEYVYNAFVTAGPEITYQFPSAGRSGYFGRWMPSFARLVAESDSAGVKRSYLASEVNFRVLKELEARNLVVPLVGDFAGDKALRAVGDYVRAHGAVITAFYTSNVEQYLFQGTDNWKKFYANVATLPVDSTSRFIRSLSSRGAFPQQSVNGRSAQLLSSVAELLKAFSEGRIQGYYDVIQLSK